MEIEFEIPQGYYTKQELENYIQNMELQIRGALKEQGAVCLR